METVKQKVESIDAGPTAEVNGDVPADGHNAADVDAVQNETQKLRNELTSEREARLRLAAEYDNYRRRTKLESSRAADEGKRDLLEQMLTIADDLELGLENLDGSADAVTEGLQMIKRRFDDVLESSGVSGFVSKGERFDPERHEAFDVANDADAESGTVVKEVRRGYMWNGMLLRPAMVVVAK